MNGLVFNSILDCAEELIKKEGLLSFRISSIAKQINCSNSSIYSKFKNKEEIIYFIYKRMLDRKTQKLTLLYSLPNISCKNKFITSGMFEIFSANCDHSSLLGVNYLAKNGVLDLNLSETAKGDLVKVVYKLKSLYDNLWKQALITEELQASKEEIIQCSYELLTFQRGAIEMTRDLGLQKVGWKTDMKYFHSAFCEILNKLNWNVESIIDYPTLCNVYKKITILDIENMDIALNSLELFDEEVDLSN